jgi:hypothetical protein
MYCLGVTLPLPGVAVVDCTSATTNLDYFYIVNLDTATINQVITSPVIENPAHYLTGLTERSLLYSIYNTYRNVGYIYRVNSYNL